MSASIELTAIKGRSLVTGASSGIGAAFARALRQRGDELVLVARRRDRLETLARELGPEACLVVPLDLTAPGSCEALVAQLEAAGVLVDLLVNNAGFGDTGPFVGQSIDGLSSMIDLNCRVPVELSRRLLPGMLARRRGAIVNVASTGAFQPVPFLNVYAATKSLVLSFSDALATELEGTGVQVQALCPGLTATEFFEVAHTKAHMLVNRLPRLTPDAVVAASLRGLERRRRRVIPGFADWLNSKLVSVLPGALTRGVAAALYRPR